MRNGCIPLALAGLIAATTPVFGQTVEKQPSPYDKIWTKFTDLYLGESNPVVQKVIFTGRFQHDLALIRADEGELDESNVRRVRLGPRITFAKRFLFHGEVEVNPQERNPFYMRITDLYVQWSKSSRLALTVGKQSLPFTQEGATSSKELLTIDRSNLANNLWFPQEYMPGVSVSGTTSPWLYRGGIYSAGAMNRELGRFNGGIFTLGVLGYDFAKKLGVKQALLIGNYVYQQPDVDDTFTRRLQHIGSVNFRVEQPKWGVRGDLSAGKGFLGQSNLWAAMLMPYMNATERLQFVTRFTTVQSDDPGGVQLATYENRVVTRRGDLYKEWYMGANYYVYGHKLKLQTGVDYADLDNAGTPAYAGWGWTTGLRVGW